VAAKAGVPILPVRLFGSYEALPMGGKKLNRHPLRVSIGKPFTPPYEELAAKGKEGYAELAHLIMAEIAKIS
ncbi:MAG: 1-acyl-sn-glycerol-3-phosphate acyltransferase, partial [Verrucomicrobium sp.]|nr:1-acyl-sn-glycerol-3-phosphate acyltransferase [Verrucomicrobium sp.]